MNMAKLFGCLRTLFTASKQRFKRRRIQGKLSYVFLDCLMMMVKKVEAAKANKPAIKCAR